MPQAARTPTPVTATRRVSVAGLIDSELRLDEVEGLTDGRDALELLFLDRDVDLFFEVHHELNEVEAVGIEIVGEVRLDSDLVDWLAQAVGRRLAEALEQLVPHGVVLLGLVGFNCPSPCRRPRERRLR